MSALSVARTTIALAPGASQGCPVASVTVSWAPRPDPDAPVPVPPCTCSPETKERAAKRGYRGTDAHYFMCPLSEPEYKREAAHRAKAIAWDDATKRRARAQAALAKLSTPAGWKAEWRKLQREATTCAHPACGYGIERPVSRYLATMGARPERLLINRTDKPTWREDDGINGKSTRNFDTHKQPCACDACAQAARELEVTGLGSTGAWTCGCNIYGLGSCRVGVDGSVGSEHVEPCARHRGAFLGADASDHQVTNQGR